MHLQSKPPGRVDSSLQTQRTNTASLRRSGSIQPRSTLTLTGAGEGTAGSPKASARAGPVKSPLWFRPGKPNLAPGMTIRTVGAGVSGLTSEIPRELSDRVETPPPPVSGTELRWSPFLQEVPTLPCASSGGARGRAY